MTELTSLSCPKSGEKMTLAPMFESADTYVITQLIHMAQTTVVLVTEDARTATRLDEELACFAPELKRARLLGWETLPYDHFSPHTELISDRLATLWRLRQQQVDVLIVPIEQALQTLMPPSFFNGTTFLLNTGDTLNIETFRADLIAAGYEHVTQVYAAGEFSIRGNLLDLYPTGSTKPFRLDLFDQEIESIKVFDRDTQRSLETVEHIEILPAREFPTHNEAITLFRTKWREYFDGNPSNMRMYKEVSSGRLPAGVEYWWPLFVTETATIFDYVPKHSAFILLHDPFATGDQFWRELNERYRFLGHDPARPCLPPSHLFLSTEQFAKKLRAFPVWRLPKHAAQKNDRPNLPQQEATLFAKTDAVLPNLGMSLLPDLSIDRRLENPVLRLQAFLKEVAERSPKWQVFLFATSHGRRETLNALLREHGIFPKLCDHLTDGKTKKAPFFLTIGHLYHGFCDEHTRTIFLSEHDLYRQNPYTQKKRRRTQSSDHVLRDLAEIKMGDPIVHETHGIGRYLGLVMMDVGEGETELMAIEYAEGAKLYVPVAHLQFITRYSGANDALNLTRLGSTQWDKARQKAAQEVRDTAAELLNLYARRAQRQGFAFPFPEQAYEVFASGFGFEETPDQAAAILAVIDDMRAQKPMDRLVCGDVGFGKTEVALRAAFLAVMAGKQVALLVPTTLLAEQHFQNFSERFALFAQEMPHLPSINIAEISRFRSGKELNAALAGLRDGSVNIVIGTHRLISPDVQFHDLGLMIIDEEHRFGVRQKEQLKNLRVDLDVLTLTATPIPRTLAMSLEGLRDFSVIATAPDRRLAVKTFVSVEQDSIICEAVLREVRRGGQVFFLYNDVAKMNDMARHLQTLLPDISIGIAHGQMRERELEHVMRQFHQQRFHLLLCSTIIETGIDIPNANTILIHRADRFGLAQLHQLRGRVGRSHHQAYAYLLTPEPEYLTKDAQKRLDAIQSMDELGAGFLLAMHDLEIRGAGEVLGEDQSGEMKHIGFALYADMLNHAINALKQGKTPDFESFNGKTEVNLGAIARLPDDYCPDVHERLILYKRFANADLEGLDTLHSELIDRFGILPNAAKLLLESHHLRILAEPLGIKQCIGTREAIILSFHKQPPIDPMFILGLVQSKKNYQFAGADKLKVVIQIDDPFLRVVRIKELLKELSQGQLNTEK